MSVIIDAVRAAQREKERRESQGNRSSTAPVLIQLRSRPQDDGARRRLLLLAVAGVVLIGASGAAALALAKRPALPAVPPLTSTILAEALAADTGTRAATPAPVKTVATTTTDSVRRTATPTGTAARATGVPASPAVASRDTATVLQGQPRANATVAGVDSSARTAGRLRVAVERTAQPVAAGLFAEAVAAHRAGDVGTARLLYDSVLTLTPRDADALNNLGVLLSAQREYGRALEMLRRATAIAPRNAGVWNNIGTVYREQGNNDEAIAAFRHALTLDPQHPGAKVGLAQQYLAISAPAQARTLIDEVVASHPQLPEGHYTLGQVLELQGDRIGAIRAYEAFIRVAPARLAAHAELVKRRIETLGR